jgi:hypothetical protein
MSYISRPSTCSYRWHTLNVKEVFCKGCSASRLHTFTPSTTDLQPVKTTLHGARSAAHVPPAVPQCCSITMSSLTSESQTGNAFDQQACRLHRSPYTSSLPYTPHIFLSRAYMKTDSALETARQIRRDQRPLGARDRTGRTRGLGQRGLFQMVGLDAILLVAILTRCALFCVLQCTLWYCKDFFSGSRVWLPLGLFCWFHLDGSLNCLRSKPRNLWLHY